MGMDHMSNVVKKVAGFMKQLQEIRFRAIGSLYKARDLQSDVLFLPTEYKGFVIGPTVMRYFSMASPRIAYSPKSCGPFLSDRDLMHAATAAELADFGELKRGFHSAPQTSPKYEGVAVEDLPRLEKVFDRLHAYLTDLPKNFPRGSSG
ncbi:hypothetical protein BJ508DRAFT_312790 [Ascobolus immersus RN42]|uniref:Uncharacterized protein n=1 Tax=Ascobolus immersus RN42 TaxID=1160509 RepID=A0A3N4HLC1_ASCIM|nr:hypothetical protein BJ508DRAFT_312790 [Ascobolus immersus RN42]